jgi:hypothetical protein
MRVRVPGHAVVNFPDDMPEEEVVRILHANFPDIVKEAEARPDPLPGADLHEMPPRAGDPTPEGKVADDSVTGWIKQRATDALDLMTGRSADPGNVQPAGMIDTLLRQQMPGIGPAPAPSEPMQMPSLPQDVDAGAIVGQTLGSLNPMFGGQMPAGPMNQWAAQNAGNVFDRNDPNNPQWVQDKFSEQDNLPQNFVGPPEPPPPAPPPPEPPPPTYMEEQTQQAIQAMGPEAHVPIEEEVAGPGLDEYIRQAFSPMAQSVPLTETKTTTQAEQIQKDASTGLEVPMVDPIDAGTMAFGASGKFAYEAAKRLGKPALKTFMSVVGRGAAAAGPAMATDPAIGQTADLAMESNHPAIALLTTLAVGLASGATIETWAERRVLKAAAKAAKMFPSEAKELLPDHALRVLDEWAQETPSRAPEAVPEPQGPGRSMEDINQRAMERLEAKEEPPEQPTIQTMQDADRANEEQLARMAREPEQPRPPVETEPAREVDTARLPEQEVQRPPEEMTPEPVGEGTRGELEGTRSQVKLGIHDPDWMQAGGYTKREVLLALDKGTQGKPMGKRQAEIWQAAVKDARARFVDMHRIFKGSDPPEELLGIGAGMQVEKDQDGNPTFNFDVDLALAGATAMRAGKKTGFYSQLQRALKQKIPGKTNGRQIRHVVDAMLKKGEVKPAEVEWTGIREWAEKQGKVTPEALDEFLEERTVKLEEVRKGDGADATRWDQPNLKTPGGTNYREFLLTMPKTDGPARKQYLAYMDQLETKYKNRGSGKSWKEVLSSDELETAKKLQAESNAEESTNRAFTSSHWDEPNVAVHVRTQDFADEDGRKWLHVEEKQSDWVAAGMHKGFETEGGVPDMPFKKNWHMLAMKRVLALAAEEGYHGVSWTTGKTQAVRNSVGNFVDRINWKKMQDHRNVWMDVKSGGREQILVGKDGRIIEVTDTLAQLKGKPLDDAVGKDMAKRIMEEDQGDLTGQDLLVGGAFHRKLYDERIPRDTNKYVKKWGMKTGQVKFKTSPHGPASADLRYEALDDSGKLVGTFETLEAAQRSGATRIKARQVAHALPLTDKAREALAKDAQPMFAVAGATNGVEVKRDEQGNPQLGIDAEKMFTGLAIGMGAATASKTFRQAQKKWTTWAEGAWDSAGRYINSKILNEDVRQTLGLYKDKTFAEAKKDTQRKIERKIEEAMEMGQRLIKLTPQNEADEAHLKNVIRGLAEPRNKEEAAVAEEINQIFDGYRKTLKEIGLLEYSQFDKLSQNEITRLKKQVRLTNGYTQVVDKAQLEDMARAVAIDPKQTFLDYIESIKSAEKKTGHKVAAKNYMQMLQDRIADQRKFLNGRLKDYYNVGAKENYFPLYYERHEGLRPAEKKQMQAEIVRLKRELSATTDPLYKEELEELIPDLEGVLQWGTTTRRQWKKGVRGLALSYAHRRVELEPHVRKILGEIDAAPYPVARAMATQAVDIEKQRLFQQIADNPEWAQKVTAKKDLGNRWKRINNPKLGALNGMAVRKDIYRDLEDVTELHEGFQRLWDAGLSKWKYGKVVLNPSSHARNFMSNAVLAYFGDVHPGDLKTYKAAAKSVFQKEKNQHYKEAKEWGLFNNTFAEVEIRKLRDDFDQLRNGKQVQQWIKRVLDSPTAMYQGNEELFKMAVFIKARNSGMSVDAAARKAEKYLFNYQDIPPLVRHTRRWVSPFVTWSYKAIPAVARTAWEKPWKMAYLFGGMYGLERYAMWTQGITPEEAEKQRQSMPPWMRKRFLGSGPYANLRFPGLDKFGAMRFLDLSYIMPFGNMAEDWGQSRIPFSEILPSCPAYTVLAQIQSNRDLFTGKDISNILADVEIPGYVMTGREPAPVKSQFSPIYSLYNEVANMASLYTQKTAMRAWRELAPSLALGGYGYNKLATGIKNVFREEGDQAVDWAGRPLALKEAVLSTIFGIKLSPVSERSLKQSRQMQIKQLRSAFAKTKAKIMYEIDNNKRDEKVGKRQLREIEKIKRQVMDRYRE